MRYELTNKKTSVAPPKQHVNIHNNACCGKCCKDVDINKIAEQIVKKLNK